MTKVTNIHGGLSSKVLRWYLVILLCFVAGFCMVKYTMLKLRVAFADGQVKIFREMEVAANSAADPRKLSGQLEYVMNYYPSGSKQITGSQLDRVVETARSNAIAAIIGRLCATTGRNLGNDPRKWLVEYPSNVN